jgi:hypothetical protein
MASVRKEDYEFLCNCKACRQHGWIELIEEIEGDSDRFRRDDALGSSEERPPRRTWVPDPDKAQYFARDTISGKGKSGHFNREIANESKRTKGGAGVDADAEDHRQRFHRWIDDDRWWQITVGEMPFAMPKTSVRKRARRDSSADSGSDDEASDDEARDGSDATRVENEEYRDPDFQELGDEDEDNDDDDDEEEEDEMIVAAQQSVASLQASLQAELDGLRTLDDLHALLPGLKNLHDVNSDWANNSMEVAEFLMTECKLSKGNVMKAMKMMTKQDSKGVPGFTLEPLTRKYKTSYVQKYSCPLGHDTNPEKDTPCSHAACQLKRTVRSLSVDLETTSRHLLRDDEIAAHIHDGPIQQAEFLESISAELGEPTDGSTRPKVLIDPLMDADVYKYMRGFWESPQAAERMETLGWIRSRAAFDEEGGPPSTPLVYQLFIDAAQPFDGGSSLIVGMLRLLNVPPRIANRNIQVAFVVDATSKPQHIDAVLEPYMDDFVRHAPRPGDPEPPTWTAQMGSTEKTIAVVPVLLDFPMDGRSMRLVAHHRESPAEEPCNKCDAKTRQVINEATKARNPVVDLLDGDGNHWREKDDAWARYDMLQAGQRAETDPESVDRLTPYFGTPVFEKVWYINTVWDLPECCMHQVANAARRLMDHATDEVGYDSAEIGLHVANTDEGKEWALESGHSVESFLSLVPETGKKLSSDKLAPSKAKPAPRATVRVMPGDRNLKQAWRALDSMVPPGGFHGVPSDILYWTLRGSAKEDRHHKGIKASAHLDNMRSGILGVAAMYSGCDPALAAAIARLGQAIKHLTARVVDRKEILDLHRWKMRDIIADLFRLQPVSERIPAVHKLLHLPYQVLLKGPLPDLWSFAFESMFAQLKPLILKNRAMPAQTLFERLAVNNAVKDCLRVMKPGPRECTQDEAGITLSSPVTRSDTEQMQLKQDLRPLLRPRAAADHLSGVDFCFFKVQEYKKLTIRGSIEIQGGHSRRRKTDNGHLLLRSGTEIPYLGNVSAIYVVSMRDDDPGQVYLDVDVEWLSFGPQGHDDVYSFEGPPAPTRRLITLDEIVDQCFMGGDPDHPNRIDNRDDLPIMNPKCLSDYERHLVYSKGGLLNQELDPRAPISGQINPPSM